MKYYDLAGKIYGRLVVLERAPQKVRSGAIWRCRCTCGRKVFAVSKHLRKGNTKSCGCLRRETTGSCKANAVKRKAKAREMWGKLIQFANKKDIRLPRHWGTFEGFWNETRRAHE